MMDLVIRVCNMPKGCSSLTAPHENIQVTLEQVHAKSWLSGELAQGKAPDLLSHEGKALTDKGGKAIHVCVNEEGLGGVLQGES